MNTVKYPFTITLREFCKFLEKHNIDIEPLSITSEKETLIVYRGNVSEKLQTLVEPYFYNNYKKVPEAPTDLDIFLWEIVKDKKLIEKYVGVEWKFVFLDKILTKLISGKDTVFYRSTATEIGAFPDDDFRPCLRFFCPKNAWEFDAIYLNTVKGKEPNVVISGFRDYDIEAGEKNLCCIGKSNDNIEWKIM